MRESVPMSVQRNKNKVSLPTIPRELPRLLLEWYESAKRPLPWREDIDPYRVWVSEIMLQQTGTEVVARYYDRFLKEFPTVEALAAAEEQKLFKLWEGLGYYTRARNLKKAAAHIVKYAGGHFPDTYEELIKLPGVGPYTAGAIASICFNRPVPAVDGNVIRVITRIAGIYDEVTAQVKNNIAAALKKIYPENRCGDFTQSLMELGALVCIPNGAPLCHDCPAAGVCAARKDDTASILPVKPARLAKKREEVTVFLLTCGENTAILHREKKGLLSGLWELPNVTGALSDKEAVALAASWGAQPTDIIKATRRSHVFTHIRWEMTCYHIVCKAQPPQFLWADNRLLNDTYPLPTAFKKFLDIQPSGQV